MRELTVEEVDEVGGGGDLAVASGIFAIGAGAAGALALIPGPQQPAIAGVAVVFGLASAGFALADVLLADAA